jgi:hypothetical protein
MAAPTGALDSQDIEGRLQALLDDSPPPPAEPENAQANKEQPAVELVEPDEGTPEGEEQAPEGEEGEPVITAPEGEEGEEEQDDAINNLSDLAKMFDIGEKEMLDQLQVDPGDGNPISLSKMIDTYKNAPESARRWEELQGAQNNFQVEAQQMRERTDVAVRDLAHHAQALLDVTTEEFKDVNWKALEMEDAQQYLILKNKQAERGAMISSAIEKLKSVEQQRLAEVNAVTAGNRQGEMQALHRKMPAWSDKEVATAAMSDTQAYLSQTEGFSAEEINAISDHRQLLVAWKASQYDKLKKQAPKKLQKLKGLPKPKNVLRSGARREASGDAQKQAQKNFDRLKKTGDERDAARLFEELL